MNYFDRKFNESNNHCNCPECRGVSHIEVEEMTLDVELDDPEEMIESYYRMVREANSENEILELINEMFDEFFNHGYKSAMIEDLSNKIDLLNGFDKE